MTDETNQLQIQDLFILLQAVSIADKAQAYNSLEMQSIKPSFDKVHAFLNAYNAAAIAQSKAAAEAEVQVATTDVTNVESSHETVNVDPVAGVTTVKKTKKVKGA